MDEIEENGQFRMRLDDDVEETVIPTAVDELRLEKISTRVTIISVLIPVLIVIVLVIAYLDIKKRVVQTEDTGSMSFQTLSNDLESRFSSLSLRQARLEEQMAAYIDRSEQAVARIEIKLKGLEDTTNAMPGNLASKKTMNDAVKGLEHKLTNIATGLEEAQGQMVAAVDQWRSETEQWGSRLGKLQTDLNAVRTDLTAMTPALEKIDARLKSVEDEKMDKPAMDLALSLEGLRIKQDLKSPLDALANKVEKLEKQIDALKAQIRSSPSPSTGARSQGTPTAPTSTGGGTGSTVKEQPLNR